MSCGTSGKWLSSRNLTSDERCFIALSTFYLESICLLRSSAEINILLSTNILLSGLSFERVQVLMDLINC